MSDALAPVALMTAITALVACASNTQSVGRTRSDATDGGVRDASTDRQSADSGPFPALDAGTAPPPYCVAPCVWEWTRRCMPVLEDCVEMPSSDGLTTCDPNTGWELSYGNSIPAGVVIRVSHDGVDCFSGDIEGFAPPPWVVFGPGRVKGLWGTNDVYCDLPASTGLPTRLSDGGFAGAAYKVDLDWMRPECSRWVDEHGVPRALLRRDCGMTRQGTCP